MTVEITVAGEVVPLYEVAANPTLQNA